MQDGTFIFTEFLMRNQKSEFFTGELENFGFIKEMNFNFGKEQIKEPYIRSVFKAQDYFAEGGLLVVKQITNPAKVFSKAKYYFDRYINNEDEQMVFSMELDAEIIE